MVPRLSFSTAEFTFQTAHDGVGRVQAARSATSGCGTVCNFIDLVVVPAGCSVGWHRHGPDDEELYIIIDGHGSMSVDDQRFVVAAGDVVINRPGGAHGLENTGAQPLRMVVVDVATHAARQEDA